MSPDPLPVVILTEGEGLGTRLDCRTPTGMTQCTFPADFTVPVVIADRLKIADYNVGIYANLIKAAGGSMQCFEAVTNVS